MQSSIHLDFDSGIKVEKHKGLRSDVVLNLDDQFNVFLTKHHLKELRRQIDDYLSGKLAEPIHAEHDTHTHDHTHDETHTHSHADHHEQHHDHPHEAHHAHEKKDGHGHGH